jgi:hypothetical protein
MDNSPRFGGAVARFENSTISGNLGIIPGLCAGPHTTLSFVTVSEEGIGIGSSPGNLFAELNSIGSLIRTACAQGLVFYQSYGGNIESPGNTCGLGSNDWPNMTETELNLDPVLADNGGPTKTHALLPGSEAIDWIEDYQLCSSIPDEIPVYVDQRGAQRDWIFGGIPPVITMCDVGAFEVQP